MEAIAHSKAKDGRTTHWGGNESRQNNPINARERDGGTRVSEDTRKINFKV